MYRLTQETPALNLIFLASLEGDPSKADKYEKKTDKIKAGGSFLVSQVKVVNGVKWYVVGAVTSGKPDRKSADIYLGAIKSIWLKGQKIELVE